MTPADLVARVTAENLARFVQKRKRETTRRMWSLDRLPMPRAFMRGPKWRRLFGVEERPIADVAPDQASWHRPGRKLLMFTLEDDVRELILPEENQIRPGVLPEWLDVLVVGR